MSRHTRSNPIQGQLEEFSEFNRKTSTPRRVKINAPSVTIKVVNKTLESGEESNNSLENTIIKNPKFSLVSDSTLEISNIIADIFDKSISESYSENKNPNHLPQTVDIENNNKKQDSKQIKLKMEKDEGLDKFLKISRLVESIPIFYGRKGTNCDEELEIFLHYSKNLYKNLDEESQTLFLNLISGRLRGEAYTLCKSLQLNKFDELEEILCKNYITKNSPTEIFKKISQVKQREQEDVKEFAKRIQLLINEMQKILEINYPKKDLEVYLDEVNKQGINSFKLGIKNPVIQMGLVNNLSEDFDEIIEIAIKLEKFENQKNNFGNFNHDFDLENILCNSNRLGLVKNSVLEDKINKQQETITFLLEKLKINKSAEPEAVTKNNDYTRKVKCEFCHRIGHSIKDCRTRKSTPFCNNCREYGHNIFNCKINNRNFNRRFTPNFQYSERYPNFQNSARFQYENKRDYFTRNNEKPNQPIYNNYQRNANYKPSNQRYGNNPYNINNSNIHQNYSNTQQNVKENTARNVRFANTDNSTEVNTMQQPLNTQNSGNELGPVCHPQIVAQKHQ